MSRTVSRLLPYVAGAIVGASPALAIRAQAAADVPGSSRPPAAARSAPTGGRTADGTAAGLMLRRSATARPGASDSR